MSRAKIAVIVATLVVVVGGIIAIGFALSKNSAPEATPEERVRLEFRGKPQARIKLAGKLIGSTPLSVYVKKSTQEITVEAFTEEHVMPPGRRPIDRPRVMTRKIVPDRDQVIDFVPPPMAIKPEAP